MSHLGSKWIPSIPTGSWSRIWILSLGSPTTLCGSKISDGGDAGDGDGDDGGGGGDGDGGDAGGGDGGDGALAKYYDDDDDNLSDDPKIVAGVEPSLSPFC